jgi:putative transcriptional regulator
MTSVQIKSLRDKLNLGQAEFGNLFGVHSMTISKWERGILTPNPYQAALLTDFEIAAKKQEVQKTIGNVLMGTGIAAALYLLLKNSRN